MSAKRTAPRDPMRRQALASLRSSHSPLGAQVDLSRQMTAIECAAQDIRFFAGEQFDRAQLTRAIGHSGPGWYVSSHDYPEEGSAFLGCDREVVETAAFIVGLERSGGLICTCCEKNAATCIGRYDNMALAEPACDECCGHRKQDGYCEQLEVTS